MPSPSYQSDGNVISPANWHLGENANATTDLKSGGGGGTSGGMESRIGALEAQMKITREDISGIRGDLSAVRGDVSTLKADVATIKETLRHLPGKGYIVTVSMLALAIVAALIAFQGHIQAFLKLN